MRTCAILSLALLSIAQPTWAETNQPRVIVDIHAPSADIRKMLFKHTPVGSSIGTVMGFISNQLEVTGSILDIRVQPVKAPSTSRGKEAVRVYLGQYYKRLGTVFLTAPMVVHEDVNAQWLFDRHGRLIDIVVDKQARVY
jgi:hypothetical protein